MPRSSPSRADQDLIAQLHADGVSVSATQLERWRGADLMPRSRVDRHGSAGTEAVLPTGAFELARALARRSRRGRPYEVTAVALFADGHPVPDHLLVAGVRNIVTRFAASWHQERSEAMAAAESALAHSEDPVDTLAVAEQLANKVLTQGGLQEWRLNVKQSLPRRSDRAEREEILRSAVTSVVRLLEGDAPGHDDSLEDLAIAAGVSGAFEKAPFADAPVIPDGPSVLRGVFSGYDVDGVVERAQHVEAIELRHARTVLTALCRLFPRLPEPLPYFLGVQAITELDGDDPTAFTMQLLGFLVMSEAGLNLAPVLDAAVGIGALDAHLAREALASQDWLNSRASDSFRTTRP